MVDLEYVRDKKGGGGRRRQGFGWVLYAEDCEVLYVLFYHFYSGFEGELFRGRFSLRWMRLRGRVCEKIGESNCADL